MTPTIGRIVLVRLPCGSPGVALYRVCPGIVCEVHSDTCISVQVFNRQGGEFVSSVVQSEGLPLDIPAGNRGWDWMPYQKAVAAERVAEGKPDLNASK